MLKYTQTMNPAEKAKSKTFIYLSFHDFT